MTTPAPPDSPQPAGEPAAADPWAPPGPWQDEGAASGHDPAALPGPGPGVPYWPPYPMPAAEPRNGLGVAAMVLGITGTVLSLLLVVFWLSWLPALLAVVFGAIGLGLVRKGRATNRGMALAGVVLGAAGLLISVGTGVFIAARVHSVNEELRAEAAAASARADEQAAQERERLEAARKKLAAEQEKKAADERARRLPFGQSYTYEDGLKVTTAAPEPFVPNETVFKVPANARIVQVRITVVNTGPAALSLYGSGSPFVRDSRGSLAFAFFDGSGRAKFLADSLAPGQETTSLEAYTLPDDAADPFTVQFTYGSGMQRKDVIWSGPAG
ncbi:DUF4190 domain-containing protein [Kitasatospora sp. NPDC048540]|uniref:DUF4190 domain-containing protein n=1 Tax=Kitasatospora sp. NPDC048540 TaxID=3155634 RepID=UPI003403213B